MTTLDSGFGFNTEVSCDVIAAEAEVAEATEAAEAKDSNSSSGPSSGMVGWLKLCLVCFLRMTGPCSRTSAAVMVELEVVELGDVCKALEGSGLTSVGGLVVVCDILGVVLTIRGGLQRGEIDFFPDSADLGCNLSGLSALLSRGDPGSALLGRLNDDFLAELGVN